MRNLLWLSLLGLYSISLAQEVKSGGEGVLPLHPQQLLNALPKAQVGWKLKRSTGLHEIDEWLVSKAERLFERPPQGEFEKALTKISIVDTAKHGESLIIFKDFKKGLVGNVEGVTIDGMPAYRAINDSLIRLQVLVEGRFVLQLLLKNQESDALEDWFELCEIDKLRLTAKASKVVPFSDEVVVVNIDELNPDQNESLVRSLSTGNVIVEEENEEED